VSIQGDPAPLASAEEARATPQPTNRGVDSTEPTERASYALVDWVEWTEHGVSVDEACSRLYGDWVESDHGGMGYRRSRIAQGAVVLYDGRPDMGVHVRMSGSACRAAEGAGVVSDWEAFLSTLVRAGRSITRLDVALDDLSGAVTVERCHCQLLAGHLVHQFRSSHVKEYFDARGRPTSRTLYLGSKKSDLFFRVYDKRLETKTLGGPWTRVELQTRDERAVALAQMLVAGDGEQRASTLGSLVLHYLDFKEPGRDDNRSRWDTALWWSAFVQVAVKRKLCLLPEPLPTAKEALSRVEQQYGPTLAALAAVLGYGLLFEAFEGARPRWRGRHRQLLAQWQSEL
jgi:phage replication initiation protein